MTRSRQRDAWIWVAVAAISLTSLARAQAGVENARAYATPLIAFFAGNQLADSGVLASTHRGVSSAPRDGSGMGLNMLPVFFVGLVSPLSLLSAGSLLCLGRALPAPDMPWLLQRPPPTLHS